MSKGVLKNKGVQVAKVIDVVVRPGKRHFQDGALTHIDPSSVSFRSTPVHLPSPGFGHDYSIELEDGKILSICVPSVVNNVSHAMLSPSTNDKNSKG